MAAATVSAVLSAAVNVWVVPPIVSVYCVGLPDGSAVGSQVADVSTHGGTGCGRSLLLLQTVAVRVQDVDGRHPRCGAL